MKTMAVRLGIPEDKILAETTSRTTFENAANLAPLAAGRTGPTPWSGHLRHAHVAVLPDPRQPIPARHDSAHPGPLHLRSNRLAPDTFVLSAGNLEQSTLALHEWVGLLWYDLRHR